MISGERIGHNGVLREPRFSAFLGKCNSNE
jgi:putative addiction module component (TIGR02574 family)